MVSFVFWSLFTCFTVIIHLSEFCFISFFIFYFCHPYVVFHRCILPCVILPCEYFCYTTLPFCGRVQEPSQTHSWLLSLLSQSLCSHFVWLSPFLYLAALYLQSQTSTVSTSSISFGLLASLTLSWNTSPLDWNAPFCFYLKSSWLSNPGESSTWSSRSWVSCSGHWCPFSCGTSTSLGKTLQTVTSSAPSWLLSTACASLLMSVGGYQGFVKPWSSSAALRAMAWGPAASSALRREMCVPSASLTSETPWLCSASMSSARTACASGSTESGRARCAAPQSSRRCAAGRMAPPRRTFRSISHLQLFLGGLAQKKNISTVTRLLLTTLQ